MGILAFLILGLIAGAIAKAILPGRRGGGWVITLVLGVVGAILGGWIGSLIFGGGRPPARYRSPAATFPLLEQTPRDVTR
jgi:uncharacterized membrane protein YeaQ/YmgE (transglycosylase-associated protein family)